MRSVAIAILGGLGVALGACGGENGARAGRPRAAGAATAAPYVAIPIGEFGRIEGRVDWSGPLPDDSVVAIPESLSVACRASTLRLSPVRATGRGVADAVIALPGIREGKGLPPSRRFEITTSRCRFIPVVQAAIAGGMLNVLSLDRVVHRVSFVDSGPGRVIDRVEQFDAGQVVPLESVLREPGPVAVRSDRLPWMMAWIHVFDHPYFAVSDARGMFGIDSIPPGTYDLQLWHPAIGWRDTTVTVTAGDTLRLALTLGGDVP